MTDEAYLKSSLFEEKLISKIDMVYKNALKKWIHDNKSAFEALRSIQEDDPLFSQKRIEIIKEHELSRSLALLLVRAGHDSLPVFVNTMTKIENINRKVDHFGVSSE